MSVGFNTISYKIESAVAILDGVARNTFPIYTLYNRFLRIADEIFNVKTGVYFLVYDKVFLMTAWKYIRV